jgi:hypothetical protein
MAKATDAQIKSVKEAIAAGKAPEAAVRINFGDAEPIQKADAEPKPADAKTDTK